MIKNNSSQVNTPNKTKNISYISKLSLAVALATTMESCGSHGTTSDCLGFNNPEVALERNRSKTREHTQKEKNTRTSKPKQNKRREFNDKEHTRREHAPREPNSMGGIEACQTGGWGLWHTVGHVITIKKCEQPI
ncbi:MAG: hypothetical protein K2X94_02715 [Amoebophilaceae bacterium]|nr:hypothetical protein [Amoebophilaceae bacterium]